MKELLFLLLSTITLTSCEKFSEYQQTIVNNSDHNITFQVVGASDWELDSFTISPNSKLMIFQSVEIAPRYEQTCIPLIDSITITIADSLQLQKDIFIEENWTNRAEGEEYTYQACTFEITNADIE